MKPFTIIVLSLLTLVACKEVTFKRPQPHGIKALNKIPAKLQGQYLPVTENGTPAKDTIIVTARGYRFGYYDPSERSAKNDLYEEGVLSDTMILKSYKGYYFLNLNENPEWLLRIIRQERNGDLIYMTLEDRNMDFNIFLQKLSADIPVDSTHTGKETLYQIDPTPAQLVELIKKGYFSETRLIKIK